MLTLVALLCYQRLLPPPPPDSDQLVNGLFLEDFNAILNGERFINQTQVSDHITFSMLRVFYTEGLHTFLATILGTDVLVQEPFPDYPDQYCKYRTRTENILGHKEAFKLVMLEYERRTNTLDEDGIDLLE